MSRNPVTKIRLPALGLLLSLAMSAGSHVGDRVYPVTYISDEMLSEIRLDDGSVDEWYDPVGPSCHERLLAASADEDGSIPDPADLHFRLLDWPGHDDLPRYYVAYVACDDVYKNNGDYTVIDSQGRHLIQRHDIIVLPNPRTITVEVWAPLVSRSSEEVTCSFSGRHNTSRRLNAPQAARLWRTWH